ncbi:MAG TPA: DUF2461 domain-containing protein [Clostridiales bacterium]|nr:DUF2461 domain-containing protein [Clostridiales bacterium]
MFKGFSQNTIDFFLQLRANNNKQWFDEHRGEYREFVYQPFRDLAAEMLPMMLSIEPQLDTNPGRAVSRINRDVRYSHDKSPYRSNMWITFKGGFGDWKEKPVYFFELFPEFYRYGMGFYYTPKEVMNRIRAMIDDQDKRFMKIHRLYQKQGIFVMEGEKYKRTLNKNISDELAEWYQRKEIYFVCNRIDDLIYRNELIDVMMEHFTLIKPIYELLKKLTAECRKAEEYAVPQFFL